MPYRTQWIEYVNWFEIHNRRTNVDLRRTVSILKLSAWDTQKPEEPRYKLIFYTTIMIAGTVFLFSFLLVGEQEVQNKALRESLRLLEDQAAALRGRLSDVSSITSAARADRSIPHPILADRDVQLIGTHADVSWNAGSDARLTSSQYELNLFRLPDERANADSDGSTAEYVYGKFFPASDSRHLTSRIPSDPAETLPPGSYVWRVAQVSPGYTAQGSAHPDIGVLSPWSNYGYFTLYKNIERRIFETGVVRVGVDISQNSPFTYAKDGALAGSDVTLVRNLIEGCLARDENGVKVDPSRCTVSELPTSSSSECIPSDDRLCVEFVSISKWGEWRPALRRKEIDLFIGGLTAAKAREGDGVSFLEPYKSYQTRLYVNKADVEGSRGSLSIWATHHRVIGVIESSSNEILLDKIIEDRCPRGTSDKNARICRIEKKTYPSFPAMDRAMDAGLIDGVLIDETFVVGSKEWEPLADIRTSEPRGWNAYKQDFLGQEFGAGGIERLAFAVAVDDPNADQCSLKEELNIAIRLRSSHFASGKKCLMNLGGKS
jgi:ABC-type amino acid transport substrate-binding protein